MASKLPVDQRGLEYWSVRIADVRRTQHAERSSAATAGSGQPLSDMAKLPGFPITRSCEIPVKPLSAAAYIYLAGTRRPPTRWVAGRPAEEMTPGRRGGRALPVRFAALPASPLGPGRPTALHSGTPRTRVGTIPIRVQRHLARLPSTDGHAHRVGVSVRSRPLHQPLGHCRQHRPGDLVRGLSHTPSRMQFHAQFHTTRTVGSRSGHTRSGFGHGLVKTLLWLTHPLETMPQWASRERGLAAAPRDQGPPDADLDGCTKPFPICRRNGVPPLCPQQNPPFLSNLT